MGRNLLLLFCVLCPLARLYAVELAEDGITVIEEPDMEPLPKRQRPGCRNRIFFMVLAVIIPILFLAISQTDFLSAIATLLESIALAARAS